MVSTNLCHNLGISKVEDVELKIYKLHDGQFYSQ